MASVVPAYVSAQDYEKQREEILKKQQNTRAEINVLEARIKNVQQKVEETEQTFQKSFARFENLNKLIALQGDKLKNLEQEKQQIEQQIFLNEEEIDLRKEELTQLVNNYKKTILYSYKKGRMDNLELLITSGSINQMLIRSFYLKKFEEQKVKQADLIRTRKGELDIVKRDLEQALLKNEVVVDEITTETGKLDTQRKRQENTVESLRKNSTQLVAELRQIRKQKEELENSFTQLIEEDLRIREAIREAEKERLRKLAEARAIADAEQREAEVAKYENPDPEIAATYLSDEAYLEFEREFVGAKGSLDWPVDSRTVSKKYGRIVNPVYGTKTDHPGIDIVTSAQSPVQVVANGSVLAIRPIRGYGDVVLVKHGSYYTGYGNLSRIDVQEGQILSKGSQIGLSGSSESEMGNTLFFLVRERNEFVDPLKWLGK
ncbi:MAG: peptidoglycan DD-metalloendopeptidase family protein [Bacteroidota bacterium]